MKKSLLVMFLGLALSALAACGNGASASDMVIIYSNGDEEATNAMDAALKEKGYDGQYVIQSLGTSELGGKLLAEGNTIEADIVTMASYFIDSAQEKHEMFVDITGEKTALAEHAPYQIPILGNMGSLFVNTEVLKQKNLPTPTSIQDLTNPIYRDTVAIPNIMDSSTGWLFMQAIMAEYGSDGEEVLRDVLENVGPHLESSGSGPLKKVQTGEVAVGFGLRNQAVKAKADGMPIEFIDPIEGNFSLLESVAVVDKKSDKMKLAEEMAQVIANEARPALLDMYPVTLFEGEEIDTVHQPGNQKTWETPLTVELLEEHQTMFKQVKELKSE